MKTCTPKYQQTFSKFIKLALNQQQRCNPTSKKVFSRKPLNNNQNSSRLLSSRLKTQNSQQNQTEELDQQKNLLNNLLKQSKNIKYLPTKSSKSVQKLFVSQSAHQLLQANHNTNKKISRSSLNNNNFNLKNNNDYQKSENYNLTLTNYQNQLKNKQLEIIYDNQKQDLIIKDFQGSTELSQNENLSDEKRYQYFHNNHKSPQILKRNQSSSFCFPNLKRSSLGKDCPNCLISRQKIQLIEQNERDLQNKLQQKQIEINKLSQKIQRLNKNAKQLQNFKLNFQKQVKLLKQKQQLVSSQKQQIQSAYKKLQLNYNKISQQIRYKEMENSINKIYKSKSIQMEMKVETLKQEINKLKSKNQLLSNSKSASSLNLIDSKKWNKSTKSLKSIKNDELKYKQPKITRIYSQDSIFSLSQEDCE